MARRDWRAARAKVDAEGACRACGGVHGLEAAHVVPRSRVAAGPGEDDRNIVPLCRRCHQLQHAGRLSLGSLLTVDERAYVVGLVGVGEAERRLA